jgi:hypothetical protein
MLDDIIVESKLPNDGAYSATGNYNFAELFTLVGRLHQHTAIPIHTILEIFGEHLFEHLFNMHPELCNENNILDFLENVETYIHVEVKKLYPEAELPSFDIIDKDDNRFVFYYVSSRQLHFLAKGLIVGLSKYLNQPVKIDMKIEEDNRVLFTVTRTNL